MKKIRPRLVRPGAMIGRMMRRKMVNSPAPSMRAASIRSSETDRMYWRMKKMPKALAAPGTISGRKGSIHFRLRMMM